LLHRNAAQRLRGRIRALISELDFIFRSLAQIFGRLRIVTEGYARRDKVVGKLSQKKPRIRAIAAYDTKRTSPLLTADTKAEE
jgi:hypothetical protein